MLAPDAAWCPHEDWPETVPLHGREEILRHLRDLREPLDRNEAAAEKLVEGGDHVAIAHLWRGVLKGTEDEVEARVGIMVTFRAGKTTEIRFFRTFADALEAAGLRE